MTVFELLSDYLRPAVLDDRVGDVMSMAIEQAHHTIPVVDGEGHLVACVRLADLAACDDPDTPLSDCRLNSPLYVMSDAHLFDAVEIISDNEVDALPVVDSSGRYIGTLDLGGLLRSVSRMLRIGEAGSVIEVDVAPRDYALGKLIHVIEEHGAKVLSVNSEGPRGENADLRVTLKVNVADSVRIRAVLEHYGHRVVALDRQQSTAEDLQQRVREFMHYLDV